MLGRRQRLRLVGLRVLLFFAASDEAGGGGGRIENKKVNLLLLLSKKERPYVKRERERDGPTEPAKMARRDIFFHFLRGVYSAHMYTRRRERERKERNSKEQKERKKKEFCCERERERERGKLRFPWRRRFFSVNDTSWKKRALLRAVRTRCSVRLSRHKPMPKVFSLDILLFSRDFHQKEAFASFSFPSLLFFF